MDRDKFPGTQRRCLMVGKHQRRSSRANTDWTNMVLFTSVLLLLTFTLFVKLLFVFVIVNADVGTIIQLSIYVYLGLSLCRLLWIILYADILFSHPLTRFVVKLSPYPYLYFYFLQSMIFDDMRGCFWLLFLCHAGLFHLRLTLISLSGLCKLITNAQHTRIIHIE